MSKSTAAYIAGFVDGEGYIGIISDERRTNHRRTTSYTCVLKIANTNKEIIDWFHRSYGGTIHDREMKENQKHAYCWTLAGPKLVPFLEKIHPYLKIKKQQAEIVKRLRKTVTPSSYEHIKRKSKNGGNFISKTTKPEILKLRNELYQKCKELNRRGILHAERLTEETPQMVK